MPIYEYICTSCAQEFEEFVRSRSGGNSVHCPACESKAVQRKMSVFAAHHQGDSYSAEASPTGACARCGDPQGPCSF